MIRYLVRDAWSGVNDCVHTGNSFVGGGVSMEFALYGPFSLFFPPAVYQVVVASYDQVFPAVDEGAKDVDDNCE